MSLPAPARRTWFQNIMEGLQLFKLMVFGGTNSSEALYNLLSTHNSLAESSHYINMGYWKEQTTFDKACEALAEQLGLMGRLDSESTVLDCGNGHGDQDAYFLNRFSPQSITGINITRSHVEVAQERFKDPRLTFTYGSATDLPFEPKSFSRVLALESAFHFDTRDDFFKEAFRVLKPNGYLATADVIRETNNLSLMTWVGEKMGRAFWQIPKANLYDPIDYKARLEEAGFVDVEIEDITEHVFRPFKSYAQTRIHDPEVIARVHPLIRATWAKENEGQHNFIYILARARKPE